MHIEKKRGLFILDLYFGERMEPNSAGEKVTKRKILVPKKDLSFVTFSSALLASILSPKYQSKMTNPLFFQYAFVTSSR